MIIPDDNMSNTFTELVEQIVLCKTKGEDYSVFENKIENELAKLYSLTNEESQLLEQSR